MKREIEFRGKRIDNGEWLFGNIQVPNPPFPKWFMWNTEHWQCEVEQDSVGQFIGGKGFEDAKNEHFVQGQSKEVKLFEGDIVEAWSEGSKGTFVIKMRTESQPTFMLYPNGQHGKMWNIAFSDIGRAKFDYYDSLRKIGNVSDNPELVAAQ